MIVQCTIEDKKLNEIDTRRTLVFSAFGFVFCGMWQYALFVKLMPRVCPQAIAFAQKPLSQKIRDFNGLRQLAIQVFVENGINNPFLYFPTFYTIKACSRQIRTILESRYRWEYVKHMITVHRRTYNSRDRAPAQIINFGFSPLWFRVPFDHASPSFGHVISFLRGKFDSDEKDGTSSDRVTARRRSSNIFYVLVVRVMARNNVFLSCVDDRQTDVYILKRFRPYNENTVAHYATLRKRESGNGKNVDDLEETVSSSPLSSQKQNSPKNKNTVNLKLRERESRDFEIYVREYSIYILSTIYIQQQDEFNLSQNRNVNDPPNNKARRSPGIHIISLQ